MRPLNCDRPENPEFESRRRAWMGQRAHRNPLSKRRTGATTAMRKLGLDLLLTPGNWITGFWKDMTGQIGYRGIVVVIAAYTGAYSIVESAYERQLNFASSERYQLIANASSGNKTSFVGTMKNFGPIQTIDAYAEPSVLEPWNWWEKTRPNVQPLLQWARHRLDACRTDECGTRKAFRINLNRANLRYSSLNNVDLYNSDLRSADLRGADLTKADLEKSNLFRADLHGATLTGAKLAKADLKRANLREVSGLVCDQLSSARNWQRACRDTALACGADIPKTSAC